MGKKSLTSTTSIWDFARMGFGLGLGTMASFVIYIFVAMIFFVPGFILVTKQKKEEKQNQGLKILGYILMAIGVIIGVGFGAGIFFNELGGEF